MRDRRNRPGSYRPRKWQLGLAIALCLALLGCGDSDDTTAESPSATNGQSTESLTVALPLAGSVTLAQTYIAEEMGFFEEQGVDVKVLEGTGSNTVNLVVSGQADVGALGVGGSLLAAKSGADTKVIYAHAGNGAAAALVGAEGVTSVPQIKRLITLAPGTTQYAYAHQIQKHPDANYEIQVAADATAVLGALTSGRADAAIIDLPTVSKQLDAGDFNLIVDTTDEADREEYGIPDGPLAVLFGEKSTLEEKREAVDRFLVAMDQADQMIKDKKFKETADALTKVEGFANFTPEQLEQQLEMIANALAPDGGYITEPAWESLRTYVDTWGLEGYDSKLPIYSYEDRVDMSYYDESIGKP